MKRKRVKRKPKTETEDPATVLRTVLIAYKRACESAGVPVSKAVTAVLNEGEWVTKWVWTPATWDPQGFAVFLSALSLAGYTKLRHLSLCNVTLTEGAVWSLSQFLASDTTLTSLELVGVGLTPRFASLLAPGLMHHTSLVRLILDHNPYLGDDGLTHLSSTFHPAARAAHTEAGCVHKPLEPPSLAHIPPDAPSLKTLSAKYCGIGPDGAASLASHVLPWTPLEELNLEANSLGPHGLTRVLEALRARSSATPPALPELQAAAVLAKKKEEERLAEEEAAKAAANPKKKKKKQKKGAKTKAKAQPAEKPSAVSTTAVASSMLDGGPPLAPEEMVESAAVSMEPQVPDTISKVSLANNKAGTSDMKIVEAWADALMLAPPSLSSLDMTRNVIVPDSCLLLTPVVENRQNLLYFSYCETLPEDAREALASILDANVKAARPPRRKRKKAAKR